MSTVRLYQTISAAMLTLAFLSILIGGALACWAGFKTRGFQQLADLPMATGGLCAAIGISLAASLVFLWSANQFVGFAAERKARL